MTGESEQFVTSLPAAVIKEWGTQITRERMLSRQPPATMECLATLARCRRGQKLYGPHDPVDYWYRILSGAARKCTLTADGRRQILEFLMPGDLFGFAAWDEHRFGVEAIVEGTVVMRYPRRRIEELAESDPEVGRQIREMAFEAIYRLQQRMFILARATARAKVGAFLLEMSVRSSGKQTNSILLPMSRYDIADYLALAVETVSRALTDLRRCGAITFLGTRELFIIDRGALEDAGEDLHT